MDDARERLRHLAHKERQQLTTDALDQICAAYFGSKGWHRKEKHRIRLECKDRLPAAHFGPAAQAYLTHYAGGDHLEDGAMVIVHDDGRRTIYPYETCEDVVILLYRFYGTIKATQTPQGER